MKKLRIFSLDSNILEKKTKIKLDLQIFPNNLSEQVGYSKKNSQKLHPINTQYCLPKFRHLDNNKKRE